MRTPDVTLLFISVPEPKATKNRVHLDLQPRDRTRDEEIERVASLGATVVADFRRADGTGWVTLVDIEGNEFCVERSADFREASSDVMPAISAATRASATAADRCSRAWRYSHWRPRPGTSRGLP